MAHSRRSSFLLLLATLAGLVLAAEVALRLVAPVADPTRSIAQHVNAHNPYIRFEYPRGYAATTEAEPGLPGLAGRHSFTTNAYGFRGDSLIVPKPALEYRVFVVGGSTAECFYLDDADDMSRVAQNELAAAAGASCSVKVYNVGLSGAASDDHIAMIAQRLVHLEPDAVVVFAGINDLRRSIQDFDYLHYVNERATPEPLMRRLLLESQIVRRIVYLKRRVDPNPARVLEARTLTSDYARKVALQQAVREIDAEIHVDATGYRDNLRSIVGLAHAHDFALVFMTHPSTWNSTVDPAARDRHWMRLFEDGVYAEAELDAGLERFNDAMRAVAAEESIPLYDLARELPKSLEYFYDDCHFNIAGARAAGQGLARVMIDRVVARSPAEPARGGLE